MEPNLFFYKKLLIQKVFEKAKLETRQTSFSGILKDLEVILRDDYKIPLSYKTLENYYKNLVIENRDYNIKPEILHDLSQYLNGKDFNDFCANYPGHGKDGVHVTVTENTETVFEDLLHRITIHITNAPVFNLVDFVSKNKLSFGLLGVIFMGGMMLKPPKKQEKITVNEDRAKLKVLEIPPPEKKENPYKIPQQFVFYNTVRMPEAQATAAQPKVKEKPCMYWCGDHYEPASCEEVIAGAVLVARNEEKAAAFRKITLPDTLNVGNALQKVWYSKTQNKIEFFTAPGLHPENGKTLKPVTKYIIDKYIIR